MAAKKTSKTATKTSTTKKTVAKPKKTAASSKASAAVASKKTETVSKKKPATKTKATSKAKSTSKSGASKESVKWLAGGGNGEKLTISFKERERIISEAAFVISQNRDPNVGGPDIDWLQAEAVIDLIFSASE